MQLEIGTYVFDANACQVTTDAHTRWSEGEQLLATVQGLRVQGYLSGSGQADLTQKQNALVSALARPYQAVRLFNDDGTFSPVGLSNAGSLSGVKMVGGPAFPKGNGPEFATERYFELAFEAEYPVAGARALYVSFRESITLKGGGPRRVTRPALNGVLQPQLVYPREAYEATQEGEAVGYLAYPLPPAPKFPYALATSPLITRSSPRRRGQGASEFPVRWHYQFTSAGPLLANPTPFPATL